MNRPRLEAALERQTAQATGAPPSPHLPARHRIGITNPEWEQLIKTLEDDPSAKQTRSNRKKPRRAVEIPNGTRVKVLVGKQWRVGTALGATAADAAINKIVYDAETDSAQAGVVTFSSTNDEWRYLEDEIV